MIRGLSFLAIVLLATVSQAATVKFSGTFSIGPNGVADPAGILNRPFLATLETDNSTNIINGQLWFNPGPGQQVVTLAGGTIVSTPGSGTSTFTTTPNSLGTSFQIIIAREISNFSQAGIFGLAGAGGTGFFTGAFGGTNTYIAPAVAAVPEPSTFFALTGLVLGCGFVQRRRRS